MPGQSCFETAKINCKVTTEPKLQIICQTKKEAKPIFFTDSQVFYLSGNKNVREQHNSHSKD